MAIPLIPGKPLNNITPFTYRDGYTYLQIVEKLRELVNDVIKNNNELDAKINDTLANVNAAFAGINDQLLAVLAEMGDRANEVEAHTNSALATIASELNAAITLFNSVVANIASVTYSEGAAWNVTNTVSNGKLNIHITVPINDPLWWSHAVLSATDNLNSVSAPGVYQTPSTPTDWAAQNYPTSARGVLTVYPFISTTSLIQTWVTWEPQPKVFTRQKLSGTWGAWVASGQASTPMTATTNFNDLREPGNYSLAAVPADWAGQNMPSSARGVLTVYSMNTASAIIQQYVSWEASAKVYLRQFTSSGWSEWTIAGSASTALAVDTNANNLTAPGRYAMAGLLVDWEAQNFPANARGVLTVLGMNTANALIQEYATLETVPRLFLRQYYGGVWSPWRDLAASPSGPASVAAPAASPAGFKRVGVPITAGHAGSDAPVTGSVRLPLLFGADIQRFRVRVRNINPRSGVTRNGGVSFNGMWLGTHSNNGVMASAVQLMGSATVADTSAEWVSPWFTRRLTRNTSHLLTFGYTADSAPWGMLATAYGTANPDDAVAYNPPGMSKLNVAPFTIALECEVKSDVPVIASIGDSNSVGVGTTVGLHDSWLNQLCRRVGALPDHRGSSGDTMSGSTDVNTFKWSRFTDLTRPDAVFIALGQNDAGVTNKTLSAMQSDYATIIRNARAAISDNVYLTNLAPRTVEPWIGFEPLRRAYNTWLTGLPHNARDLFNIAVAVSTDDDNLAPGMGNPDGIHWSTAGNAAVQNAISRPVVAAMV